MIADIHFQPRYVFAALDAGCAAVRVNPGNIKKFDDQVKAIAHHASATGTPIRIGVNAGSLDERLLAKYGQASPQALVESALWECRLFEEHGFTDLKIAVKHHDPLTMVAANRLLAAHCDYPLHLGVTEAGPAFQGAIKSSVAMGILLAEGIGDTIRVSLSAPPVEQVKAGSHLLQSLGLRPRKLEIVSCPGCGRLQVDLHTMAARVEAAFDGFPHPLRIAVMGCVVNGPGVPRGGSGRLLRQRQGTDLRPRPRRTHGPREPGRRGSPRRSPAPDRISSRARKHPMNPRPVPAPVLSSAEVPARVEDVLARFLAGKARQARAAGLPVEVADSLTRYLAAGGKRLRPQLCLAGYHAAQGDPAQLGGTLQVAASLELFHAFALIHDDVIDQSSLRRGQPTVHCRLAALHARSGARDGRWLGISQAILISDTAHAWSDELLRTAALSQTCRARLQDVVAAMREEVLYGQYLDLLNPLGPPADLTAALAVIRYKTAKYTVERPLHIGAVLAGADAAFCQALARFALPIGEAFQLRDDLLGVFGDAEVTGKSTLDDLREGKHTALLALAHQRATPVQQRHLTALVGRCDLDESAAARIRSILEATGARTTVEEMITQRSRQAEHALSRLPAASAALDTLRTLAHLATQRIS